MIFRAWSVCVAVVSIGACAESRSQWTGRVLETAGAIRVENPARPLAGPAEVTIRQVWSRAGPDEGAVWEVPNRVHVRDGVVFVVDRAASRVHRVTTAGAPLPSLGEPGPGPGQYRRITDAVPTEAGLFVIDVGNARVEVLSDSGEVRASLPLDRLAYGAFRLDDDAIALYGAAGDTLGWVRLFADGTTAPLAFPDLDAQATADGPVSTGTAWNGRLVRLRYTTPEVGIWSGEGVLEREIVIPLPVERVTDAEIERLIREETSSLMTQGLPAGVLEQVASSIRAWPREKKRFRKIVFDDVAGLAAIWEQNPEDFGSGAAILHLLTLDGVYLAALEFDRAWSDMDLDGGMLYTLARDPDTDLVTLAAHELSVPARLLDRARSIIETSETGSGGAGP